MSSATGTKTAPIAGTSKEIPQNESTTEEIRQRAYEFMFLAPAHRGTRFKTGFRQNVSFARLNRNWLSFASLPCRASESFQ